MRKNQKGFAAIGIVVLVVVLSVVVGGGYYVLKHQGTDISTRTQDANVNSKQPSISANGTPENAAEAVAEQLNTEIKIEDDGADQEAQESDLDPSSLIGVEEAVDASNL